MKFKSALVTQASGSVGGMTAAHNKGGLYLRARATPTNPATAQQIAVRNFLATLTTAWQETLTAAQREAWATYAENVLIPDRLGEPRNIGGIGHYVRSNVPRLQAGLTRVDDGPTIFDQATFTTPTLNAGDDESLTVNFTDTDAWVDETGAAMLVYASRQQALSINFFKGPYRFVDSIDGDDTTPPTTPASPTSPFGLDTGNKQFYQVRVTRADGRLSPIVRTSALIV